MITETLGLLELRRSFAVNDELGARASAFLRATLVDWQLDHLLAPIDLALTELMCWMSQHGTSADVRCVLTWDHDLLFVELSDRGGLIPEPHISRVDAELACRLLEPPAVGWGAELDSRGRQLWAAFSALSAVRRSGPVTDRGTQHG